MIKNIKVDSVYYEMLLVDAKKKRINPQKLVEQLIENSYNTQR